MCIEPLLERAAGASRQAHSLGIFDDETTWPGRTGDHDQAAGGKPQLQRDRRARPAQRVPDHGMDLGKARCGSEDRIGQQTRRRTPARRVPVTRGIEGDEPVTPRHQRCSDTPELCRSASPAVLRQHDGPGHAIGQRPQAARQCHRSRFNRGRFEFPGLWWIAPARPCQQLRGRASRQAGRCAAQQPQGARQPGRDFVSHDDREPTRSPVPAPVRRGFAARVYFPAGG
jgi:hypothetical protein